jgi:hypothetical protein
MNGLEDCRWFGVAPVAAVFFGRKLHKHSRPDKNCSSPLLLLQIFSHPAVFPAAVLCITKFPKPCSKNVPVFHLGSLGVERNRCLSDESQNASCFEPGSFPIVLKKGRMEKGMLNKHY